MSEFITYKSYLLNTTYVKPNLKFGERYIAGGEVSSKKPFWEKFQEEAAHRSPWESTNDQTLIEKRHASTSTILALIRRLYPVNGPVEPNATHIEIPYKPSIHQLSEADAEIFIDLRHRKRRVLHGIYLDTDRSYQSEIKKLDQRFRHKDSLEAKDIQSFYDFMVRGAKIELNSEKLQGIVNSPESCMFVLNHPPSPWTELTIMPFISKLYKDYSEKTLKGQRPPAFTFVWGNDYQDTAPDPLKSVYEKVGMMPVNPFAYLSPLIKKAFPSGNLSAALAGFNNDKRHILIVPEGSRVLYEKQLPLQERFQSGTGIMIARSLIAKESGVKVVPMGIHHNQKSVSESTSLGAIEIGEPLYFHYNPETKEVSVKGGNTSHLRNLKAPIYRQIKERGSILSANGKPVLLDPEDESSFEKVGRVIAGLLMVNIEDLSQIAEKKVPADAA